MANKVKVAELLVEIGLDSKDAEVAADKLEKELGGVEEKAGKVTEEMGKLGKQLAVFAAAVTAAAIGAFKLVESVAAAGDEIGKAAKQFGTGIEEFQRLKFAVEQSGASVDSLQMALKNQARFLRDSEQTAINPFTQALAEVGLRLEDIASLKTPEERFGRIGDALQRVEDPAKRTALAMKLVGEESGPRLLPFLLEGTEGMRALGEEAQSLGLIMSEEAVQRSEQFQSSLGSLKAVLTGVRNTIGVELMPVVERVIKGITEWTKANRGLLAQRLENFLQRIVELFERLAPVIEVAGRALLFILEHVETLAALFVGAKLTQGFRAVEAGLKAMGVAASAALGPLGLILRGLTLAIPLALEAGNALGDFLARDPNLRRTKRRTAPVATPETNAARAAVVRENAEVRRQEDRIRALEGGSGIESRIALQKAREARDAAADRQEAAEGQLRKAQQDAARAQAEEAARLEAEFPLIEDDDLAFTPFELKAPKKAKKKEKAETSITSISDLLAAASGGGLEDLATTTPSTKGMEPTVAVDITNNNFSFAVTQNIRGTANPTATAEESTRQIKREFDRRLSSAGQKLAGNLVR